MLIDAAKASNKMIFECPNRPFGGIASVNARRDKLEVDVFGLHVVLECLGAFIVKAP
jgi:hypothetical protein